MLYFLKCFCIIFSLSLLWNGIIFLSSYFPRRKPIYAPAIEPTINIINTNSGFFPTSSNPKTTGSVGIGMIDEMRPMRRSPNMPYEINISNRTIFYHNIILLTIKISIIRNKEIIMISVKSLKSKYTGCMLGAAIGDALGKQNEGVKREDILKRGCLNNYGKAANGTPGDKLRPGDYTDDTEQMLVLAGSLIENNGLDVTDFSHRIAKWGKEALKDPIRKSFVGPTSALAIERLYSGVSWKDSGGNLPSCGSAMRVAPVGLFWDNLDGVESNAALSSIPTHNSNTSIAGAVAVAIAVRCAFDDKECADIISETCARTSKYDTGLAEKIKLAFELKDKDPEEVFSELGTSYLAIDTVPCAFYCFTRHFDKPESAIIEAVNAGGDTDSIACITGAFCGALHGSESLPARWIEGLENRGLIEETAGMMCDLRLHSSSV